jgi:hypothetical protein
MGKTADTPHVAAHTARLERLPALTTANEFEDQREALLKFR